jgi:hypothetical protein
MAIACDGPWCQPDTSEEPGQERAENHHALDAMDIEWHVDPYDVHMSLASVRRHAAAAGRWHDAAEGGTRPLCPFVPRASMTSRIIASITILFPVDRAVAVLRGYHEIIAVTPDTLTAAA